MKSLEGYVTALYKSHSPEELAGVEHVSYFVTHGVTGHTVFLLDPASHKFNLREDDKPPADIHVLVGWKGLRDTNTATMFEQFASMHGEPRCDTYVLAWDEKRAVWGTVYSWRSQAK